MGGVRYRTALIRIIQVNVGAGNVGDLGQTFGKSFRPIPTIRKVLKGDLRTVFHIEKHTFVLKEKRRTLSIKNEIGHAVEVENAVTVIPTPSRRVADIIGALWHKQCARAYTFAMGEIAFAKAV